MTSQLLSYLVLKVGVQFELWVFIGFEDLDALLVHLIVSRVLKKVQLRLVSVSYLLGTVEYVRLCTNVAGVLGINRSGFDCHF